MELITFYFDKNCIDCRRSRCHRCINHSREFPSHLRVSVFCSQMLLHPPHPSPWNHRQDSAKQNKLPKVLPEVIITNHPTSLRHCLRYPERALVRYLPALPYCGSLMQRLSAPRRTCVEVIYDTWEGAGGWGIWTEVSHSWGNGAKSANWGGGVASTARVESPPSTSACFRTRPQFNPQSSVGDWQAVVAFCCPVRILQRGDMWFCSQSSREKGHSSFTYQLFMTLHLTPMEITYCPAEVRECFLFPPTCLP